MASAIEIGRRFLDVDEEIKAIDQESDKLESNNINNVASPKNNQISVNSENEKDGGGGGGEGIENGHEENADLVLDILNDDVIAQVRLKIHSEFNWQSKLLFLINFLILVYFSNSLNAVASKELFEPCFVFVKSYLAGEPFREFEASMYFYRYVHMFILRL